ncbi:hypothetical protein TNCV_330261 [Trichonephila clavipes]|nr:hypothetical protein TNCV_330261 [Trichonephila clavipes]
MENKLVLLKDPNTKPLNWPMGRILEVFPGSDGLVRVVNVKTTTAPEPEEFGNVIEEVVDFARQLKLEVDSYDIQELDSHDQELPIDELIKMHEQEQGIEKFESSDPVQSDDRMMVCNLTEGK